MNTRTLKIIRGTAPLAEPPKRPIVTFGTYDGVHLGHQQVLRRTLDWARAESGDAVVLTFEQHPRTVLSAAVPLFITSLQHRLFLLEQIGMDLCVVLEFDKGFGEMTPERFVEDLLVRRLRVKGVVLGHGQRFGKEGRGDINLMRRLAEEHGFHARAAEPVAVEGRLVSSTAIRELIARGDLESAAGMLGRRVSVMGTVVHRSGLGKRIGYPTANLDLHHEAKPPEGVYHTLAFTPAGTFHSLTNIGPPPSFNPAVDAAGKPEPAVEVHLLDFSGSLYDQDVEVRFIGKIRDLRHFDSVEPLCKQIQADIQCARDRIARHLADPRSP